MNYLYLSRKIIRKSKKIIAKAVTFMNMKLSRLRTKSSI